MKKQLLSITLFLSVIIANAQTDTLFYFAAPEITKSGTGNFDRTIKLRITSYSLPTTITISQPASPSFSALLINIPPDSLYSVDLTSWIDSLENKPANTILNYGLKIQSTSKVSIYYEVVSSFCNCNPEIFVLKGQTALGVDFWIPSQNLIDNSQGFLPVTNSSFDIVTTQNNTSVTIIPSRNIIGHGADTAFTIILNEGQTYSAMAASGLAVQHLMGSRVTSNNPIAITIKDDDMRSLIFGTCSDLGGDQIVPSPILGTEYIAINGGHLNNIGDQIFILATHDTTVIYQNGNSVDTINAGETRQLDVGDSSTFIVTSHPSSVLQISGIACEYGIDILPQINCTGSDSIALARSTTEPFYLNLLVPNGGQNGFLVNGNSGIINGAIFKQVPGTGGQWLSGQLSLSTSVLPVGGAVLVTNPSTFHISVLHGGGTTGARFGYFSDFACPIVSGLPHLNPMQQLLIYPNPATSQLNIRFSSEILNASIEIYNAMGARVISISSFNGIGTPINIDNLTKGIYFVKVSGSKKSVVKKFAKQ